MEINLHAEGRCLLVLKRETGHFTVSALSKQNTSMICVTNPEILLTEALKALYDQGAKTLSSN
jgi:hypothetical protein